MKLTLAFLTVCVAYACANPVDKRGLLDTLGGETGKILVCEGKMSEEDCQHCCVDTQWLFSFEKSTCLTACLLLPSSSDYLTTYAPYNKVTF